MPKYELPDPLVCFDGQAVTDVKMWREARRLEVLRAFATNIYGRTPDVKTRVQFEITSIAKSRLKAELRTTSRPIYA